MDIGIVGKSRDGGIFSASGMKAAIYNGSLHSPVDENLPNTEIECPYVIHVLFFIKKVYKKMRLKWSKS